MNPKSVALFSLGVGGNLASILISRMTTRLSIMSNPTVVDDVVDEINAATLLSWLHAFVEKECSCEWKFVFLNGWLFCCKVQVVLR